MRTLSAQTKLYSRCPVIIERAAIEERMIAALDDEDQWIGAACTSLVTAGGKHLRASLLIHCAGAVGANPGPHVLDVAAAVEMVHLGTLVHDDIVDRAATRRGAIAVHEQWGNWTAAFVGARMFLQAATTLLNAAPDMRGRFFELSVELCVGQVRDIQSNPDGSGAPDEAVRNYLLVAYGKTASLFSFTCELGAFLGNAGKAEQQLAARWGASFGLLYQVVDDIIDLFGDEHLLGKPPGSDLCEGRRTFPWIIANLDPEEYRQQSLTDRSAALTSARRRLIEAGGVDAALNFAGALARETESIRVSLEGEANSPLSLTLAELMGKLEQISPLAQEATQTLLQTDLLTTRLPAILSELHQRPQIEADFRCQQVMEFLSGHAQELITPSLCDAYETASTELTARLAAETTRAVGGDNNEVSETGRWCALALEAFGGLEGVEHAKDCRRLMAADAALVVAVGRALTLNFESATDVLRGMVQSIRQTLRAASSGLPFGVPPNRPVKTQLQPLIATIVRVAARDAGASPTESRAIAQHWVMLMQLSTEERAAAWLTPTLLGEMHQRIERMSLSEPAALLASLSDFRSYASP